MSDQHYENALAIWHTAVAAANPKSLLQRTLTENQHGLMDALAHAKRIVVVGGGKAGSAMAMSAEELLPQYLDKMTGIVNVPAPSSQQILPDLKKIKLHVARPAGSNQPTADGVVGSEAMLELIKNCQDDDVALCLLSGGGSALLPAPAPGISLSDKQEVTQLLHKCGATINEMNCVRKHLSAIKGGRLAQSFTGKKLYSLIISDVIGDPLDVIASGPTAIDPTTFVDAMSVLEKYDLMGRISDSLRQHLEVGSYGKLVETAKELPENIHNVIIGNNVMALECAHEKARSLGYHVLNLGSYIEGETSEVAKVFAGIIRSIREQEIPNSPPVCVLSGGETTVTLGKQHGLGGRNQELVLAMLCHLGKERMNGICLLSGGTDGEDGPTDAAGAIASVRTLANAEKLQINPKNYLNDHDAYNFFSQTNGLVQTGLTNTNVMDVRVCLITSAD